MQDKVLYAQELAASLYYPAPKRIRLSSSENVEIISEIENIYEAGPSRISPTKPTLVVKDKVIIPTPSEDIFKMFIDACKSQKSDDETTKILDTLNERYKELDDKLKEDEEFRLFISKCHQKVSEGSDKKIYSIIQDVHKEVQTLMERSSKSKIKKVRTKRIGKLKEDSSDSKDEEACEEESISLSEEDKKRVTALEKTIAKCKEKLIELENREVNFDEEEDSAYLQADRYSKKLIELYQMLGNIVGDQNIKQKIYKKQIRTKDICSGLTSIPSIDAAIISSINSNIKKMNKLKHIKYPTATADYLRTPSYVDILEIIKLSNKENNLHLNEQKIKEIAVTAFKNLGQYLKKKRIAESEEFLLLMKESDKEQDPAKDNSELQRQLKQNEKEGNELLNEVFKKHVQNQESSPQETLEKSYSTDTVSSEESENEVEII